MNDPSRIDEVLAALDSVHSVVQCKFEGGLGSLAAVVERMVYYGTVMKSFIEKAVTFFVATFTNHVMIYLLLSLIILLLRG